MPYLDKEKQRSFGRTWIQKRREVWFQEHGPCVQCGSWDSLELDHIDPSQKTGHRVWSWSDARRQAELTKCQPLCRACHKQKTIAQFRRPIVHGTKSGYSHYGCRCDQCRAANTAYARQNRENRERAYAALTEAA